MPLQLMSHWVASVQSTPAPQLPALAQTTRHGTEGGHTTRPLHG
jgi:hypothetical protein